MTGKPVKDIKYVVVSVVGPHAGESENEIFERKVGDIKKVGFTFWIVRSFQAKPEMIWEMGKEAKDENQDVFCLFIEPSVKGGALPTKHACLARCYSEDKVKWKEIPPGLSPVTGQVDKNCYALMLNELRLVDMEVDLWQYADFFNQEKGIRIFRGGSTLCAVAKDMRGCDDKITSHFRKVVAVGKLAKPFCVWLKEECRQAGLKI